VILASLDDTRALAQLIARRCLAGSLLLLAGPLGAGKTTLVQQLALELGSVAAVSSPTYTLIHEYPTPLGWLVHCDAYRLPSALTLIDLGLDDYLARSRLVGAPRLLTLELSKQSVVVQPALTCLLVIVLDVPTGLSLVLHKLRRELPALTTILRDLSLS